MGPFRENLTFKRKSARVEWMKLQMQGAFKTIIRKILSGPSKEGVLDGPVM